MSIFFSEQTFRFPVPLIAFEALTSAHESNPVDAIVSTLVAQCRIPSPSDEDVAYFIDRFNEYQKLAEADESDPISSSVSNTRGLGTSFREFVSQQSADILLLMAVGYDYQAARFWYTSADFSAAQQVINNFVSWVDEANTYAYEAALYAYGGHYSADNPVADSDSMDGDSLSAADLNAFQFH